MTARLKTPTLDERKVCERCLSPFRCPTAQADRIICGPCTPIGPRFAYVEEGTPRPSQPDPTVKL